MKISQQQMLFVPSHEAEAEVLRSPRHLETNSAGITASHLRDIASITSMGLLWRRKVPLRRFRLLETKEPVTLYPPDPFLQSPFRTQLSVILTF